MPLVRVEMRNEYGLGAPELYKDADKEDPKALLEGLAVAGLVGILRQLGDLAEFAAEVFHGLQEQVTITSSRSHKLTGRVKQIEATLPPLEKLVLAQRSHLHFAYTTGLNWRANLKGERCHFMYSDLPRFMMDSYDQCRGPPNLNLLDKFDPGGPGSCLRRYSDPSFFKRLSTGRGMAHKKSRKIKKSRSWLQIGENSPEVSNYSESIQFSSLNMGEETSPCPTVSTYDVKKLDLGDQFISFDSRNGSVGFEHVSHPRTPLQYKEKGSVGSCSSQSMVHNSHHFATTDKDDVQCYDSPSSISSERTSPITNQVTWDEKMGMFILVSKKYDHDGTIDTLSTNLRLENEIGVHLRDESMEALSLNHDLEIDEMKTDDFHTSEACHAGCPLETPSTNVDLEKPLGTVQLETAGLMDILLENGKWSTQVPDDAHHDDSHLDCKKFLKSNSGYFQHDEIESETDHFVDALNAIESEYESDVDCITKQEVEQHPVIDNKENSNAEVRLTTPHSRIISSYSEIPDHTNASSNVNSSGIHPNLVLPEFCSVVNASPEKIASTEIANSAQLDSRVSSQPQVPDEACSSSRVSDVDSLKNDIAGSSNTESAVSDVSFLGQDMTFFPRNHKNTEPSTVLPTPQHEPVIACSTTLWTNGGLFGLEPSKPPDFSTASVAGQVPVKTKEVFISSSPELNTRENSITSFEEDAISECCTFYQDDRKGGILTRKAQWISMSADLGVNLLKLSDPYLQSYSHNFQKGDFSQSGAVQPISPHVESSRAGQENISSSRMLELGNKLLLNGFYRKPTILKDGNSVPTSSVNENSNEQSTGCNVGYQTFSTMGKEVMGSVSPTSPASSPPLGHMKISFQPLNGSDAPKLQLKFPDGNINNEGVRDLFTSFQLVPDSGAQLCNADFHSDDDTFCGSSPCGSDYLSHQSDSNSEQWESSESPSNKDKELYDALRRISLTESVSTSWETGGAVQREIYVPHCLLPRDMIEGSHSSQLFDDLPSLDSIHPSCKDVRSECVPEQPKLAPLNEEKFNETAHMLKSKPQDLRKLTPERKVEQAANGKREEKGDFLQQIRAKSLNLRRTATEKPTVTAGTTTSAQVYTILEKANAIRQAVGSDWEDDNWSDT